MNPDSSIGIYVTASVQDEFRMISHNWKMQYEENKRASKVNKFFKTARVTKCGSSFVNLHAETANLPRDTKTSEYPRTPPLKFLLYLYTDIIKDFLIILEGRSVSCRTKRNAQSRQRLCRSGDESSWEDLRAFCENKMFLETCQHNKLLV